MRGLTEIEETKPHLKHVVEKMCEMVGANPEEIDFREPNWFYKHQWTENEEAEFIKWMTDYLMDNKQARQELLAYPIKAKKRCRGGAEEFVWNYGWKISNKSE